MTKNDEKTDDTTNDDELEKLRLEALNAKRAKTIEQRKSKIIVFFKHKLQSLN